MNKSFQLALLLAGSLAAAGADAAERGFYIGAGAGQMNTEVDDVLDTGFNFDEKDTGLKVFAGYTFLPWLGVEAAYIDGGSPKISASEGSASASLTVAVETLVASANFTWPVSEKIDLFVKPGIAYWDSTTTARYTDSGFDESDRFSDNGSAFFLGVGAALKLGHVGLRLEYEWFDVAPEYDFDEDEFGDELDARARFISLSATYRF